MGEPIKFQSIFQFMFLKKILPVCCIMALLLPLNLVFGQAFEDTYSSDTPIDIRPPSGAPSISAPSIFLSPNPEDKKKRHRSKKAKKPAEPKQKMLKDMYIEANKNISEEIDDIADDVDVFLAGKKVTDAPNNSGIRLENSLYYNALGEVKTVTHFNLNLRLPNLEKKWQLKFTSYDENEEDRRIDQRQFRTRPKKENYGASLLFFRQLGKVKTTFQPRLELKDPLEMSYVLTFETRAELKGYRLDPKVQFFARPEKGVGVLSSLPLSMQLSPIWELTLAQEVEYEDRKNMFTHNSGMAFGQKITEWSSLGYSAAATSNNRETYHLQVFGFAVTWQHMFYQEALSYSVAPTWDFAKGRNFKGVTGLRMSLDFIF